VRYRWTILAVGVGAQTSLSALQQGMPALGPALRDAYSLSLSEVGVVLAAASWGILGTLLFWGWLADRTSERVVIATGLGLAGGVLVATSQAASLGWLIAGLVAAGALGASSAAASGRAVMGWFPRTERGFALGIRQMAVPLGGAIAALTLPVLGGIEGAMLALAAGCFAGAAAAAVWLREPPPPPADRPKVDSPPPLRDPRVWRLSVGSGLLVCAQVAMIAFVVLFLHDHRGLSAGDAAVSLAVIQIGGGVARMIAGRRSDQIGRRIIPLRNHALAMAALLLATGVLADAPLLLLAPILLGAGIMTMSWNGLSFTAAAELAGRDRAGTALGLQGTIMRVISAGAGVGFGAIVAATSWPAAFALLALLPLGGWFLLRPLVEEEESRVRAREKRLRANKLKAA
jgi:sugar phosphate permease